MQCAGCQCLTIFNTNTYVPFTKQEPRCTSCKCSETVFLPLPFCHVVYQDKVRKEVTNAKAVVTIPFRSLISFHHHIRSYIYDDNQDCCFSFIPKSMEFSTSGSRPVKIYLSSLFQMLCRRHLSSKTTATQDRPGLHTLMSQAFFFPARTGERKEKNSHSKVQMGFFLYNPPLL